MTNRLSEAAKHLYSRLSYLPRTLRLAWSAARYWHVAWLGLLALQGVLPVASVYITRILVDTLVSSTRVGSSWEAARPALVLVTLMVAVLGLAELLNGVLAWVNTAQSELVQDHISGLIHAKTTVIDLSHYDSPDYHDLLHRVRSDSGSRSLALIENTGGLLQNGITLLAMAGVLLPYGWWIPVLLFLGTLPALLIVLTFHRRYHRWWDRTTPDRRWAQYFDSMLTHEMTAAELRLFDLGGFFRLAYQELRRRLRRERVELGKEEILIRLTAGATALLTMGSTTAWMIWRAQQGFATLGDLALFQQAFSRGQSLMRSLQENVGRIYSNTVFVHDLFEFLAITPRIQEPSRVLAAPRALDREIRFRDVMFAYGGRSRTVLKNVNLSIPAGQTVAIVGPNGAGKSTLIKLLCRFYDPDDGRIEFDGTDIRAFGVGDLRRMITVLFQLPVQYHATAAENIALGDRLEHATPEKIEAAARAAGADEIVARLPRGYDTPLGRHFANGVELSQGEAQRFALARAFFRRAPIIVLDEPTSFMDSWAETAWLERFRVLAQDRTAILITHRFTTAMQAHVIYVMQDGQIVEFGRHDQLVAAGGFYAQSWNAQMSAGTALL